MTTEEAVKQLLADPALHDMLVATYVTRSPSEDAEAFISSGEFAEVLRLIGRPLKGLTMVDLGAGRGIASHGFAKAGATKVYAIEPDPSDLIGYGAIKQLPTADQIEIVMSFGESIPLPAGCADVVYVRQVLHHAQNLEALVAECYRLLKPGGIFIACREHIADDEKQLKIFLANHPVHQLAGGEYAFPEARYVGAVKKAGFIEVKVLRFWDSVINAYPEVTSQQDLQNYLRERLRKRLGLLGSIAGRFGVVRRRYARRLNAVRIPGRMYSFVATK